MYQPYAKYAIFKSTHTESTIKMTVVQYSFTLYPDTLFIIIKVGLGPHKARKLVY